MIRKIYYYIILFSIKEILTRMKEDNLYIKPEKYK